MMSNLCYLNYDLLSFDGLLDSFNQQVIQPKKTKPAASAASADTASVDTASADTASVDTASLGKFKSKLQQFYFPNLTPDQITKEIIQADSRFDTYPDLKQALTIIFLSDNKEKISAELRQINPTVFPPNDGAIKEQWRLLNGELGYFKDEALFPLFSTITRACRAMSVLVEENLADENMPYTYAYRLMALFLDRKKQDELQECFNDISKKTSALLNMLDSPKQYHDVILNRIQLPKASEVQDLGGWLKLIQSKNGIAFLPFFAMAPQIEAKNSGKAPLNLIEAKDMAAICFYKRASENTELAKLCKPYNIPEDGRECSFNTCLDYLKSLPQWPMKDSDNLPHPVIIGSGAAEGYCWVKLPTDDLRALILGVMTGCCQNIGGNSEQCVKDAITLPDNGLYVLLKRKHKKAIHPYTADKINDAAFEIVGQSYAWISSTGNLTLDSLECSEGRVTLDVAKTLLTQFAEQVLADNASIKRITLGMGGGTPRDIGFSRALISEYMRSGFQYGDSRNQYCIARRAKIPDEDFNNMMDKLDINEEPFKETLRYLSDYLSDTSHFEEELRKLLTEFPALARELNPDTLFKYLSLTTTPTLNDLYPVDLEALSIEELSQISTARLAWRKMTPEQLLKVFACVPKEEDLTILQAHKGILHRATDKPELLKALLASIPERVQLAAIKGKDGDGRTVLHCSANNPELLKELLEMFSPEQRLLAIKEKNNRRGMTILHCAAEKPESLKILLESLRPEDQLAAITEKDGDGKSVLHDALHRQKSLEVLLAIFTKSELLAAITKKDGDGKSVLHDAVHRQKSLEVLLAIFTKSELLAAIKEENGGVSYILRAAIGNPRSLNLLLEILPESDFLAAIKEQDRHGSTILYYVNRSDSLKLLLKRLPEDQLLQAINEKNKEGMTVLNDTYNKPESLRVLLTMLPERDHLAAIIKKDLQGRTIFHIAANSNPEVLRVLFEMISKDQLLQAIKERNSSGETVLEQLAVKNSALLIELLKMLPEELLKELPKDILELPFVQQFIQQKSSQSTQGFFKPKGSDGAAEPKLDPSKPTPHSHG